MQTYIYMVRHGDSPKRGNERTRDLTEKGKLDAQRITSILKMKRLILLSQVHTLDQF